MTDWGSHGSGMDHETQTPVVAWGAGLSRPEVKNAPTPENYLKQNSVWNLDKAPMRKDINQTDVAPLMSALIGVHMPQNNVGKLPLNYLRMHASMKLKAAIANMLQVWEQFLSHTQRFQDAVFFRQPFSELDIGKYKNMMDRIKKFENNANYDMALNEVDGLFGLSLKGIEYYQRYHRTKLYIITSISYIGFIFYLIARLMKTFTTLTSTTPVTPKTRDAIIIGMVSLLAIAAIATIIQNVPLHYFVYYASSIFVWSALAFEISSMKLPRIPMDSLVNGFLTFFLTTSIIETLIASFFDRRWLSLAIFIMMAWQLWMNRASNNNKLNLIWILLCIVLSAFCFQPSVGKEKNVYLPIIAGLVSSLVFFLSLRMSRNIRSKITTMLVGTSYLSISGLCAYTSTIDFLVIPCHFVAWTILLTAVPLAIATDPILLPRLMSLAMALQSAYLLLSLTYEGLFLLCMILIMVVWVMLEHKSTFSYSSLEETFLVPRNPERTRQVLSQRDVTRALMFFFLSVVSFFGTGNIASLNSFDPASIQTLVSVFNPFLMGSLLLVKVLIPFLVVACFVCVVQKLTQMPPSAMFFMVLLFSDIMGLHFFFLVTDQGSWQEIGTSLSHFVIAEGTVIFLQIFFIISKYLLERPSYFG